MRALAWISGRWLSEVDGGQLESMWMAPTADMMPGILRTVRGDETAFFEYLRIEREGDSFAYVSLMRGAPASAHAGYPRG